MASVSGSKQTRISLRFTNGAVVAEKVFHPGNVFRPPRPTGNVETDDGKRSCDIAAKIAKPHDPDPALIGGWIDGLAPFLRFLNIVDLRQSAVVAKHVQADIFTHALGQVVAGRADDRDMAWPPRIDENMIDAGADRDDTFQIGEAFQSACRWPPDDCIFDLFQIARLVPEPAFDLREKRLKMILPPLFSGGSDTDNQGHGPNPVRE